MYLFINDDRDLLGAIGRAFGDCNTVVFAECHSVEDALRAVQRHKPEVVFLDHHLTEDGEEGFQILPHLVGIKVYSTSSDPYVVDQYTARGVEHLNLLAGGL